MATPDFFGPEFHVNTTTADDQDNPSVTALANGKFVAVWEDDRAWGCARTTLQRGRQPWRRRVHCQYATSGLQFDPDRHGTRRRTLLFASGLNATVNVDTIADFKQAGDVIELDNAIFSALAKTGHLKGGFFEVGKHAGDHSDHIIYNQKTGKLFYDADGKGGAAQIEFAILGKHLDLTSHDFLVV